MLIIVERKSDTSGPTEDKDNLFDVAIEDAAAQPSRKRGCDSDNGPSMKRQKKNERFGFGGKKRFSKSGDAASSGDMRDFSVKKMKGGAKGGAKRPGKSRRAAAKGRD